jgi:prevent-host-death family protein
MIKAGVRQVKAHLSQYLHKVKYGDSITITEHGYPVALLISVPKKPESSLKLRQLVEQGDLLRFGKKPKGLDHPIICRKSKWLSSAVLEDRG